MKKSYFVLALTACMLSCMGATLFAQDTTDSDLSKVGATGYTNCHNTNSTSSTSYEYCDVTVTQMPSGTTPGYVTITGIHKNLGYFHSTIYISAYFTDKNGRKFIVTKIGDNVFENNTSIEKLYLNYFTGDLYNTEKIGGTKRVLNTPFEIGYRAFYGCSNLQTLELAQGSSCYINCKTIGAGAFNGCTKMSSCKVLATLGGTIGQYAFNNCKALTAINVSGDIHPDAFDECSGVKTIYWYGGSTTTAFRSVMNTVTKIYLYGAVPKELFEDFTALTEVNTPANIWDNLKNTDKYSMGIGSDAFKGCKNLTTVSVAGQISPSAFANCPALTSITYRGGFLNDSQIPTYYFQGFFYDCRSSVTSFTIESSSTQNVPNCFVPSYLCISMEKLTEVTIPDYVFAIGSYAFSNCSSLTKVTFNKTTSECTLIGNNAFQDCSSLSSIALPVALESIYDKAFSGCKALTSCPITADHTNLKTIGEEAFCYTGFKSAYIPAKVNTIGSNPFSGSSVTTIDWQVTDYTTANPLGNIKSKLTTINIGDNVTYLPEQFANGSAITELNIPNSLESIGQQAFANATSLSTITINQTVPAIASNTFEDTNVKTIYASCSIADAIKSNASWKAVCNNIQSSDSKYTQAMLDNMLGHNTIGDSYEYYQWTFNGSIEIVDALDCDGKVTLRCVPENGYTFAYWRDNGSTDNPRTFDLSTYDFWQLGGLCVNESSYFQTNFSVEPEDAGYLNITNQYGHDRNNQKFIVESDNETAYLTPMEKNGWYRFDKWENNGMYPEPYELYDNPGTYSLNLTLSPGTSYEDPDTHEWIEERYPEFDPDTKALFVLKDIPVSFVNCPDENGSVEQTEGSLNVGSEVTLVATPNEGYLFDQWADGNTNATRTLTITPELLTELKMMGTDPETGEMTYEETPVDMGGGTLENYHPESEYILNLCAHFKVNDSGVEDIQTDIPRSIKVIRNGVIYIIRNGKTYNVLGAEVK